MAATRTDLSDIDLLNPDAFVEQKHHDWFRRLATKHRSGGSPTAKTASGTS